MNSKIRIKDSREFEKIIKNGFTKKNEFYILYYYKKGKEYPRFGITFSKKFGKAHKRNDYKRKLREIIRKNQNLFKKDYDYIIIMRKLCDTLDYYQMESKLREII